jgi:hypothetical protein
VIPFTVHQEKQRRKEENKKYHRIIFEMIKIRGKTKLDWLFRILVSVLFSLTLDTSLIAKDTFVFMDTMGSQLLKQGQVVAKNMENILGLEISFVSSTPFVAFIVVIFREILSRLSRKGHSVIPTKQQQHQPQQRRTTTTTSTTSNNTHDRNLTNVLQEDNILPFR